MLFFRLLALAALVAAAPEAVIDRRTAHPKSCNRDNLLRALVDSRYSSSALIFCSSFLSLPAASTTTTTQTIRTAPPVVTSTVVVPSTTTTVTVTFAAGAKAKREQGKEHDEDNKDDGPEEDKGQEDKGQEDKGQEDKGQEDKGQEDKGQKYPNFVACFTPPASRVSSACSCLSLPLAVRTVTATTTLTTGVVSTTMVTSLGPALTATTTVCPIVTDTTITTTTTPISTVAAVTVNSITTVTITATTFTSTVLSFVATGFPRLAKRAVDEARGPLEPRNPTLTCPTPSTTVVTATALTMFATPTVTSFGTVTRTSTLSTNSITARTFLFGGQCVAFGQPCPANGGVGGATRCCQSAFGTCANPIGPGNVGVCVPAQQATAFFPPGI